MLCVPPPRLRRTRHATCFLLWDGARRVRSIETQWAANDLSLWPLLWQAAEAERQERMNQESFSRVQEQLLRNKNQDTARRLVDAEQVGCRAFFFFFFSVEGCSF